MLREKLKCLLNTKCTEKQVKRWQQRVKFRLLTHKIKHLQLLSAGVAFNRRGFSFLFV